MTARVLVVVAGFRFFLGAGGVSDSSSERIMARLGLAFGARLRFRLRGCLGMSRWIQRRSAIHEGINGVKTGPQAKCNIRPISQYAFALES
jgi:hypothetical protein